MPNHFHGILIINKTDIDSTELPAIGQSQFQNHGKNTISSIVGSYKSIVTKASRQINPNFRLQPPFYDQIIRNVYAFENIQNYIANNPAKWKEDIFRKE
ncbi:hypothetical protein ACFSX9_00270 [Flavobacterium ardleyense]|uniref:Transposase IS200-like domain-containing protein n=1 Tax=Flavobacterium ardleyense TaxID=2038737 RepID=A0ABW5Z5N2_9FLAO